MLGTESPVLQPSRRLPLRQLGVMSGAIRTAVHIASGELDELRYGASSHGPIPVTKVTSDWWRDGGPVRESWPGM